MKAPVEANDGDNSSVYTHKARHESTYSSCMELVMVRETKQMQGLTNDIKHSKWVRSALCYYFMIITYLASRNKNVRFSSM